MGAVSAILLFASILLHELGHSVVGMRLGMKIRGITLFIFGGVAELDDEPDTPRIELLMAIAGPIVSIILAGIFYAFEYFGVRAGVPVTITGIAHYLWIINLAVVIFNMVPGFPLDGGRVLRATLWHFTKSIEKATKITSNIGAGFGYALIALGIFAFIQGAVIAGMWYALIGLFLSRAAKMSYQKVAVEKKLQHLQLQDVMTENPVTVAPSLTLDEFVKDYCLKYNHHGFPVVENEQFIGFASLVDVTKIPAAEWFSRKVDELMWRESERVVIPKDATAEEAFEKMTKNQVAKLVVLEDGKVVGVITIQDLAKHLQIEAEVESVMPPIKKVP